MRFDVATHAKQQGAPPFASKIAAPTGWEYSTAQHATSVRNDRTCAAFTESSKSKM